MEAPIQSMNLPIGGYEETFSGYLDGGEEKIVKQPTIKEQCAGKSNWFYKTGCWVGSTISRYGASFIVALFVVWAILVVVSSLSVIAEAEVIETNASIIGAAAAYANAAYHQKCKSRGGCTKSCPYISESDPRVVICQQADSLDLLYGQTKQVLEDDKALIQDSVSVGADGTIGEQWTSYLAAAAKCSAEIGVLMNKVKELDSKYGNTDTIDLELMDAKNKAIAYGAAAVVQKNALIITSLHINSQIMNDYIKTAGTADTNKRVANYDKISYESIKAADELKQIYVDAQAWVSPDSKYQAATTTLSTVPVASQDVLTQMALLLSMAQDSEATLTKSVGKLSKVSKVYEQCKGVMDSFNNDLPGKMDHVKMTELIEANDYETAVIKTALESDIVPNHQKFAKERSSFESGGGIQSVRDDPNDINSWVGIYGKPTYRKSDGSSAEISAEPLKSIPSDKPDSLMTKSSIKLTTRYY